MNTKEMPHDYEAEVTLLGTVLLDQESGKTILQELELDDFYENRNKTILAGMLKLFNQSDPVDVVTLTSLLTDTNKLYDAGGVDYLLELSQAVPTIIHTEHYIKMLKEKTKLRRLIKSSLAIAEKAMSVPDNLDEFIDKVESEMLSITRDSIKKESVSINNAVTNLTTKLLKIQNNRGVVGIPSGYREVDKLTLGFQNGDLIIIAARPSMGKTAFALNLASNIENKRCMIFSLEMSSEQLAQRLMSCVGKLGSNALRNGDIIKNNAQRYYIAAEKVSSMNIVIEDNSAITINEIMAKARKEDADEKLDLIIIDYLQLINSVSNTDRQQQISEISRKLKILARELDVPIICLSQLSRKVEERHDKRPMLSDLRESGAIEQDADIVMFLYREAYYNFDSDSETDVTDVIISKNRNGATGTAKVAFEKMFGRFSNIAENKNVT